MSSSAASLCAAAGDTDSQTLDGFEIILAATPEPPVVESAANNHLNEALSQQQPLGTVVNLPPSEAGSEEPSAKRIRYSDFPVWQVGVECTGLELCLFSISFPLKI
jgi:hypothetical protein